MKAPTACLALLLFAGPALADAALEPRDLEQSLVRRITAAGFACPGRVKVETPTVQDQEYGRQRDLRVQRLRCGDGRSYLVSRITWGQRHNPPPGFVVPVR